jgi:hypothetical protein
MFNFGRPCQALRLIREAAHKLFLKENKASSYQRTSSSKKRHTCTNSGSKLQTRKHSLMALMNHVDDQATYSEHLMTMALPAKSAAKMGDQELCNAEGGQYYAMAVRTESYGSSRRLWLQPHRGARNVPLTSCNPGLVEMSASPGASTSRHGVVASLASNTSSKLLPRQHR